MNSNKLLTINELATVLNIKISRLRTAVFRKEIPVIRIGRLLRFDIMDIYKWIESQKETPQTI